MQGSSVLLTPAAAQRWLESSSFRYPPRHLTEQLVGFGRVPVYPTLWGWFQREHLSPDSMVSRLFEMRAAESASDELVLNRARKLVLDFGRDLHAMTLLAERFGAVRWRGDYDYLGVDYLVRLDLWPSSVGVQASMRASWSDSWDSIKAQRKERRGEKEPAYPIVHLTNRSYQAAVCWNGTWLYRPAHIDDVCQQIRSLGYLLPEPLLL